MLIETEGSRNRSFDPTRWPNYKLAGSCLTAQAFQELVSGSLGRQAGLSPNMVQFIQGLERKDLQMWKALVFHIFTLVKRVLRNDNGGLSLQDFQTFMTNIASFASGQFSYESFVDWFVGMRDYATGAQESPSAPLRTHVTHDASRFLVSYFHGQQKLVPTPDGLVNLEEVEANEQAAKAAMTPMKMVVQKSAEESVEFSAPSAEEFNDITAPYYQHDAAQRDKDRQQEAQLRGGDRQLDHQKRLIQKDEAIALKGLEHQHVASENQKNRENQASENQKNRENEATENDKNRASEREHLIMTNQHAASESDKARALEKEKLDKTHALEREKMQLEREKMAHELAMLNTPRSLNTPGAALSTPAAPLGLGEVQRTIFEELRAPQASPEDFNFDLTNGIDKCVEEVDRLHDGPSGWTTVALAGEPVQSAGIQKDKVWGLLDHCGGCNTKGRTKGWRVLGATSGKRKHNYSTFAKRCVILCCPTQGCPVQIRIVHVSTHESTSRTHDLYCVQLPKKKAEKCQHSNGGPLSLKSRTIPYDSTEPRINFV